MLEFSDTEHYALTLLVDQKASGFTPSRAQLFPSITALELRKNYTEVMIDDTRIQIMYRKPLPPC